MIWKYKSLPPLILSFIISLVIWLLTKDWIAIWFFLVGFFVNSAVSYDELEEKTKKKSYKFSFLRYLFFIKNSLMKLSGNKAVQILLRLLIPIIVLLPLIIIYSLKINEIVILSFGAVASEFLFLIRKKYEKP